MPFIMPLYDGAMLLLIAVVAVPIVIALVALMTDVVLREKFFIHE